MPARYDAVVIGGGLLGCTVAWMLARDSASVLLAERDQLNAHASGQNAGSLHFQLEYRMLEQGLEAARTAAEAMPLHLAAAELWAGLADELGEDLGLAQDGGLMLAEDAEQARVLEAKSRLEQSWGLDVQLLDGHEARRIAPYLSDEVVAAAYCPIEGKADTRIAAPAFARGATRAGAQVRTRTEVVALRRSGTSWLVDLATPDGAGADERVVTDAVVLAAGVWTGELGALIDARLPTIPMALTMTATTAQEPTIAHLVQHAGRRLSLKQASAGNVLIGGGWPARLLTDSAGHPDFHRRPELIGSSVAGNLAAAVRAVPWVASVPALRTWVGTTTVTPDQLPLVGAVPGNPGVYVATGGSAFTLGPSFAQVIADLVQHRRPGHDLAPYDPARFDKAAA
ncbi:NAD(P)/FAD-dependent oxidoreductase [Ruania halotolerans]|uniref:NAD(P)/FAD-dependent oxidoreductase n=1 Tax=Ruania halotolerans TaxID=2897773 RepID=UPI001E3CCCF7|nr:FAD-dependent oxidoreductase [Ruania halotolerans]UFU06720.1 FAD-binding oxidoreductase [Ruania halotolerans]